MNRIINIKNKKAINEIEEFKKKKYSQIDIKFCNLHLMKINELVRKHIFSKNDLYINSTTLWELMQPIGKHGSHNYHGLMPNDILTAMNNLLEPYCIFIVKESRYAVIPTCLSSFNEPLMFVVGIGAELINNKNANINKIITIYPKSNLDEFLNKLVSRKLLFKK